MSDGVPQRNNGLLRVLRLGVRHGQVKPNSLAMPLDGHDLVAGQILRCMLSEFADSDSLHLLPPCHFVYTV